MHISGMVHEPMFIFYAFFFAKCVKLIPLKNKNLSWDYNN